MIVERDSCFPPVRSRVLIESSWDGHRNLSMSVLRRLYGRGVTNETEARS